MDLNNEEQIIQIKKVFLAPFLLIIAIVIFFISLYLINLEYKEYFNYGQITTGNIVETYWESSGDSPPTTLFICKVKAGSKNYIFEIQNADNSVLLSENEQNLIEQIKKGDPVKIKILNEKKAKILEWNQIIINSSNQFWNIFGTWLSILILLTITGSLLYKIYLIYGQPDRANK